MELASTLEFGSFDHYRIGDVAGQIGKVSHVSLDAGYIFFRSPLRRI